MNAQRMAQWQRYKALELISDSAPVPKRGFRLHRPIELAWRSLLNALMWEHFYEQRTEYLERCWLLDDAAPDQGEAKTLQKLWMLMD